MIEMTSVLPVHNAISEPWFQAAAEGKLLIQKDPATGAVQMYPRARVVEAPEREPEWVEASGFGTLHTFTTVIRSVHQAFGARTPFTIAIIDLDEGARITSWMVNTPVERLRCDMRVKVVFREIHPGITMPCFTEA